MSVQSTVLIGGNVAPETCAPHRGRRRPAAAVVFAQECNNTLVSSDFLLFQEKTQSRSSSETFLCLISAKVAEL